MSDAIHLRGMFGLGDSIYMRPHVRAACESHDVYLTTSWPELFTDLPVRFVRRHEHLRTQRKNVERQPYGRWTKLLPGMPERRFHYQHAVPVPIREAFNSVVPSAHPYDLPPLSLPQFDGPYAVIRPVTVRAEWRNSARNCLPEYLSAAAGILRAVGFRVISVADLVPWQEWLEGPAPPADVAFHAGELRVLDLLSLVAHADVVVGPVGWILPACLAAGTPLVLIAGGQGGRNNPRILGQAPQVRWILPDPFCGCVEMQHGCAKVITGFDERFTVALKEALNGRAVSQVA